MEQAEADDPVARARERVRKRLAERRQQQGAADARATTTSALSATSEIPVEVAMKAAADVDDKAELSEGEQALADAREWLLQNPDAMTTQRPNRKKKKEKQEANQSTTPTTTTTTTEETRSQQQPTEEEGLAPKPVAASASVDVNAELRMWIGKVDVVGNGNNSSTNAAAAADGLYVGSRPRLSDFNAAAWRSRLIARLAPSSLKTADGWNISETCTTGRTWLDTDGSLPTILDALKPLHERPESVTSLEPLEPCAEFTPAVVVVPSAMSTGSAKNAVFQLEITIQGIALRDHPLFIEEDFLATQLGILVHTFCMRQEADLPGFCAERFRLLVGDKEAPGLELAPAMREQALRLCEIWREEETIDRHLLKRIAGVWKRLSAVRQEQGFACTEIKLSLKLLPRDQQLEEALIERDTLIEFAMRSKQLDREIAKQAEEEAERQQAGDVQHRPLPTHQVLHDVIRQEIGNTKYGQGVKRYRARLVSDPQLLTLAESAQLPAAELERRERIARTFFVVELIVNGHRATRTSSKPLCRLPLGTDSPAMTVVFSEVFPVQVAKWPDSLSLAILTVEGGRESEVGVVPLVVPVIETGSIPRPKVFTSSTIKWRPTWEKAMASTEHSLIGAVLCCAQWAADQQTGRLQYPPIPLKAKQQAITWIASVDQEEAATSSRLKEWLASSDPNDPTRNIHGNCLLGNGASEATQTFTFFDPLRLQGNLENTRRQRLLRLRRDGRFHGVVPLLEEEITDEMLAAEEAHHGQQSVEQSGVICDVDDARTATTLELQCKGATADYFELLTHKKQPRMAEVVTTERVSFFNLGWLSTIAMPKPARPLCPERLEKPPIPLLQLSVPVRVLVQVLHATGLPARRASLATSTTVPKQQQSEAAVPTEQQRLLEEDPEETQTTATKADETTPFVQISLSNKQPPAKPIRTRIATGTKPTWNESLIIGLCSAPGAGVSLEAMQGEQPFDFVFGSAEENKDAKLIVALLDDAEETASGAKPHYVAEISVNLRNLLWYSSRFEGALRLHEPAFSTSHCRSIAQHIELSVLIALDPPLAPPATCEEYPTRHMVHLFGSRVVGDHVLEHCKALQALGELRQFSEPYAMTLQRKAVLLSQTIRDVESPPGLTTWRQLARFVSLIPPRDEPLSFVLRRLRVVATLQETLDMRRAGILDRAALLCSLLHVDRSVSQVYVVLGIAQGEGAVAYVLFTSTEASGKAEQIIVSPETGEWFYFATPPAHLHLVDVDTIFNKENIWANLQPRLTPLKSLNLDLANAKCWKPLFSQRFPQPADMQPFQPEIISFVPTDTKFAKAIQRDVEKHIVDAVEQWRRPRLPTHWNRVCSRSLAELLPSCEDAAVEFGPGTPVQSTATAHYEELERWRSSFPDTQALAFGMPLGNIDDVIAKMGRTQLHLTTERKAEFGLAVHIVPYPCRILALWVYFAALR